MARVSCAVVFALAGGLLAPVVAAEETKCAASMPAGDWARYGGPDGMGNNRQDLETVKRGGKKFLLEARIETHHKEVAALLERIHVAQFVYASQHGGTFGDMNQLINAGLIPQDLLGTETTGYRFRVTLGKDSKTWAAFAEPARHNRTGRLSFYRDPSGLQSKDTGGKPIKPSSSKQ